MQRSLRGNVLAVLLTLPAAFGLVWLGCATADEEVDATPKRAPRDSGVLVDEDGNIIVPDGSDGDGMIFPTDDSGGPLCPGKTATPNSCAAPTDVGTISAGGMKTIEESIAATAGDLWYKVTFGDLEKTTAHPSIKLVATDKNIVMEVNKSCAGEGVPCMDMAGTARNITHYEVTYSWDAEVPAADAAEDETGDSGKFKPIEVGDGGVVYVHVYRNTTGAKTGCSFKLEITN
jgi:hypothetical protein